MALDGKLLAQAKGILAERRKKNEALYRLRQSEVYEKAPKVKAIDADIQSCMAGVIAAALSKGGDTEAAVKRIGDDSVYLQRERREALKAAGFPEDWLDEKPLCPICGDTGYVDLTPCKCLMELYHREQSKELSSLLNIGSQCFETFQLKWYSNDKSPSSGVSPRDHMAAVFEVCKKYAETFGTGSDNLFLTGGPGLGKTFLSACIAKTVFEKGASVVYATAGKIFSDYESARFSRGEDSDNAKSELRRYTQCDLLIFDDLGTEMTTSFTVSALYELVNTRLTTGKKTVISTNLSISDITTRYSPQIASRLSGEYQILPFYGTDIRILKKNSK